MTRAIRISGFLPFLLGSVLYGQTGQGSITGTIRDPSSLPVADAKVLVTNTQRGTRVETKTSSTGVYTVADVPYGNYSVTVSSPGFQTSAAENVVVSVGQVSRLDLLMNLGQVTETVTVQGSSTLLQQDTATVQTNFSTKQMVDLPLALGGFSTRSPEAFTFLTPGVVGDTFLTTANGGQSFSNEVLLDGGSAGRSWSPGDFDESAPSVDSIGEFTIKTNAFQAEYGRTGSSITSFVLKSGTNDLHGSAYEFLRNPDFDATGFDHVQNLTDRKNDFGFTVGGPVVIPKIYNGRNKTFFFFSYEHFLTNLTYTHSPVRYPTVAQQGGDFGELLRLANPVKIYDPLTGQQFPNNVIPANRISSVSKYATGFLPKPNLVSGGTGLLDLYNTSIPTKVNNPLYTVVIDENFTSNQRFHFSWSGRDNNRTRDPENLLPLGNPLTQFRQQDYRTDYYRGSLDTIIRPNLLNHWNFSFDRVVSTNGTLTAGLNFVKGAGLTGVQNSHTPTQFIDGYATLGNQELNTAYDNRYEIQDSLSWVKGSHSFKFGIDTRRSRFNQAALDNSAGSFHFSGQQTADPNGIGGNAFASYLLGAVHDANLQTHNTVAGFRSLYIGSFAQDDWKVTSKLTVNYGLRWDIEIPRSERFNRYASLDPSLPNPAAGNIPGALAFAGNGRTHFDKTRWTDFGPRLGISYAVNDKTVIRVGYGIYYNQLFYNDFGGAGLDGFDASPSFSTLDGRSPAFYWQNGFPQNYAHPPFTDPSGENTQGISYFSPDSRPPQIQSWNFGVEREVAKSVRLSAFYVANKGTHLFRGFDIQQLKPEFLKFGDVLRQRIDSPAAIAAGFKTPYPTFVNDWGAGATVARSLRAYPQYNSVGYVNNTDGNSTYNSLQVKAETRFSNGLTFLIAYTFSKNLTNADSANQFASNGPQNDYANKLAKSLSGADRPHVLAASYLYELPIGRGKRFLNQAGLVDKVVGGWELTGILQYNSGPPLNFGADCPSLGPVFAGHCYPNFTRSDNFYGPGKSSPDPNNGKPYLLADGFSVPGPYQYGNVPRNTNLRLPLFRNENLALLKNTRLFGEKLNVQFRAETFNTFNRVIFNGPDTFVGQYDPSKPGNINRNDHFGFYSGQANTSRILQLGLKVIF